MKTDKEGYSNIVTYTDEENGSKVKHISFNKNLLSCLAEVLKLRLNFSSEDISFALIEAEEIITSRKPIRTGLIRE